MMHVVFCVSDMDLAGLDIWPPEALERLSGSWITTAEQVVAIAATQGGISALAVQTELPRDIVEQFVDRTRQVLPSSLRDRLSRPADTSQFGTGANRPPDDSKD
ncbi:hypothetical protein [uncultured Bradyrhizobium sp.]|jgi:hypothetical protein|uniref:hypothetical protein n=1 Tax=uncultured Bradyrhizobium sp. TaxID=199684 RepID=UPI00260CB9BE|nr:hypothetical protein [uncultured Bradyrhizobium sp.]